MHGICCTFYPQSANQCIALCRSYPVVSKNTNGRRICRRFVKQKPCLFHKLVSIQHFPLRWLSFASWFNTLCREMNFTKFHSKSSSYHKHHTVLKHRLPFASVIPFFVSEHWTALSSRCLLRQRKCAVAGSHCSIYHPGNRWRQDFQRTVPLPSLPPPNKPSTSPKLSCQGVKPSLFPF